MGFGVGGCRRRARSPSPQPPCGAASGAAAPRARRPPGRCRPTPAGPPPAARAAGAGRRRRRAGRRSRRAAARTQRAARRRCRDHTCRTAIAQSQNICLMYRPTLNITRPTNNIVRVAAVCYVYQLIFRTLIQAGRIAPVQVVFQVEHKVTHAARVLGAVEVQGGQNLVHLIHLRRFARRSPKTRHFLMT